MSAAAMEHGFQYESARHQSQTAVSGIWLFLASEMLFFGVLFLSWIFCRFANQPGFDAGAQQSALVLGTVNTVLLLTSSVTYTAGNLAIEAGNRRGLIACSTLTGLLGVAFLVLK